MADPNTLARLVAKLMEELDYTASMRYMPATWRERHKGDMGAKGAKVRGFAGPGSTYLTDAEEDLLREFLGMPTGPAEKKVDTQSNGG